MEDREEIIDKEALARSRVKSDKEDNFLQKLAVREIKDRLKFIKKRFEKILIICVILSIGSKLFLGLILFLMPKY